MMNALLPRELKNVLCRQNFRNHLQLRTLVSSEFMNQDAWQTRLAAPVFKNIKMQEYFTTLDKKFTHEFRGSAVDVDIFANNVQNSIQAEHMEELLFKLRRTPHTLHTLESTHHAAVRAMLDYGETENLVKMLDDRMNYGVFLDEYSAVLTLDKLLESGDYHGAARCASQLMLQEEDFKLANQLGNLATWKYISSGREVDWFYPDEIEVDPNPDEVIRVRVKNIPNKYTDDHFELRDPDKILGKTLIYLNKNSSDIVGRSLTILGKHLFGNASAVLSALTAGGEVAKPVLDILQQGAEKSEKLAEALKSVKSADVDIDAKLMEMVEAEMNNNSIQMIDNQKNIYQQWNLDRDQELKKHYEAMQRSARIQSIEETKVELENKEEELFFFDNYDKYEMEKVENMIQYKRTMPRYNWNVKNRNYKKKKGLAADGERKIARWEKREAKMGPPK